MFKVGIITSSDKGSTGEREDLSGPIIAELVIAKGYEVISQIIVADEKRALVDAMVHMADDLGVDLILTTGGTGFSKRDVTPEATLSVCDRVASGIAEAIRYYSLSITPRAMLSRAVSGIRGDTLIVNLPGSPKAVKEALDYALDSIHHGLEILTNKASDCARK
ncbi:MAG: MogA/MoaB family molybdenum cofactor biosynthesis protein [Tissierellia bacterium]|jgi:molybdenum cofactor synthesis domain-containing protein|nr:MogA/MoaB family molybdenum cofactor biosynthesis protein [Tissierellia bacterium]